MDIPAIGVEEEYQLVDPVHGAMRADCKRVMSRLKDDVDAEIQHELHLTQIEMASPVCATLNDAKRSLIETRRALQEAAAEAGSALSAAGTNPLPLPHADDITPSERYNRMTRRYQQLARDLFIFGCHVHVSMPDKVLGVEVMNRARRWLPTLLAVSANSPFWDGHDTGYASYRRELWAQWPMAGPPPHFVDFADYNRKVSDLIEIGAIADESFIYWDIRLPEKIPTIEFRVADVMLSIDDVVAYVGLIRGIVMQSQADIRDGVKQAPISTQLLRYTLWHAARYGMDQDLIDPIDKRSRSAVEAVEKLVSWCRPSLQSSGDEAQVDSFVERLANRGNGASMQRLWAGKSLDFNSVVRCCVEETSSGLSLANC
ncbi:glutamate--cysteine ligase [Roseiconus lacunae]|uniref:Putative glutamate--cysteine ligase 2 n=1 Tax=Roseiconus lacunae TaxID=2605694 RepID=A0ABT7PD58_9BACT|nr:glutamate--cysteine ligase [Roseiconus lacunae]MDM4014156.1 glutamate--cysteine ligase [Roseiconus lacunae]WRQ53453.1 glutamate--cysteine ligase [Stieleria sp. HD01]